MPELDGEHTHPVKALIYKEGRPKRNSNFLVFIMILGIAGVVAFSILAVTTQNSKMSCPCANPYKQIGYERILDMGECTKDNSFVTCTQAKTRQWTLYTGLAGGSGGLLLLSLVMLRYG